MPDKAIILVVEDDDAVAEMVVDHLTRTVQAEVLRTASAAETLRLDLDPPPDVMLVDILLPDGNGLDLIRMIRAAQDTPVLLMSAAPTLGRVVEAMRLGVRDLFTKPFDLQRLTEVVTDALTEHRKQQRNAQRLKRLERLSRKVIEERRVLQERVDLVCQDLVTAYRDLAHRFTREIEIRQEASRQR